MENNGIISHEMYAMVRKAFEMLEDYGLETVSLSAISGGDDCEPFAYIRYEQSGGLCVSINIENGGVGND